MTHKEIFEALLDGKKLNMNMTIGTNTYIELLDGEVCFEGGQKVSISQLTDITGIFQELRYQVLYWDNDNSRYAITNRKYISEKAFKKYFYREATRFIRFIKDTNS